MWKNKPPPQSSFAFLKSFVMGEGGYTNELFVGLETYMTVGQGGAGVTGCLDIHSRGERGPEFNSPTREGIIHRSPDGIFRCCGVKI